MAAVAHTSFWLALADDPFRAWGLFPFNLLAFGLLVWSTAPGTSTSRKVVRSRATRQD